MYKVLLNWDFSHQVHSTRLLLDRIGGLSMMDFFSMYRSVLLGVFSLVLTYLIIMLEFKKEDPAQVEWNGTATSNATTEPPLVTSPW